MPAPTETPLLLTRERAADEVAGKLSSYLTFPCTVLRHEPDATYTVEAEGKTYTGCTTEYVSQDYTRLWLQGRPEIFEATAEPAPYVPLPNADERCVPRRNCVDLCTPAEKAIYDAMHAVEGAGADVRLTDAINLLQGAKDAVADHVDGIERRRGIRLLRWG